MPFTKVNNQEIFYNDTNGTGPAVIFMHGFLMDQSLFDSQVKELSPHYRCVSWDARGFGQTKWDGKPFNLYDSVKDCLGLMDHLGIKSAVLVGMSQGGYCALRTALVAPERVNALVLMSTKAAADPEPMKAAFRDMRDTWHQAGPVTPLLEGLATAILGPMNEPEIEKHWNHWLPKWKKISGDAIFHAMNNLLDRDEISHRLHEISCPVLITHGENDTAIPVSVAEDLRKKLPHCLEVVISPGSHAVNMTHAHNINPSLKRFLKSLKDH